MLTLEQQNYAYNAYLETMRYLNKPKSLLHPEFSSNSAMYVFTTENLVDYIKKLKPENKNVLTITGSGDQLINLALMGTRKIDNFDVNQNAYFITQLKLAALQALSYEEFLDFFCLYDGEEISNAGTVYFQKKIGENDCAFSFKTYLQIKPYLDETSAFFWNLIYEDFQFDGKKLASSSLFYSGTRYNALKNNVYLRDEESYLKARDMINNVQINYIECNLLEVHKLSDIYDIMLFSNVYDYLIDEWYNVISEEEFVDYIESQASQRLSENGTIAVAYQYGYKKRNYANQSLVKRVLGQNYTLEKRLPLEGMKKVLIPSTVKEYRKEGNKDCVYLYEKGKSK